MASLLRSILNTKALPTGDHRYIRSDNPRELTDLKVDWLYHNNITAIG